MISKFTLSRSKTQRLWHSLRSRHSAHRKAYRTQGKRSSKDREKPAETIVERLTREGLRSLPEAFEEVGIKKISLWTLLRYAGRGVKGPSNTQIRLESLKIGGRRLTSVAAVRRFLERLNPEQSDYGEDQVLHGSTATADESDEFLEELGLGRGIDE